MQKFFVILLTACSLYACQRHCSPQDLEIRFNQKNAWLVSGSAQELQSIVLPNLHYTHSNCWTEEMEEFLSSPDQKGLHYKNIVVDSAGFHVSHHTGLVRGNGTFNVVHKGKDLSIHLCFTETYVCTDGQWMLFARHAAKL